MSDRPLSPNDDATLAARTSTSTPFEGSRLGVYAALDASVGAVPLPWLPDALGRRVRGALVHDIAVRHGLSLTPEAREVLADPAQNGERRGAMGEALRFVGVRLAVKTLARVGPVRAIWPLRNALRTYALGHLLHRYLARSRKVDARTIEAEEARRIRRAIDSALLRATTVHDTPAAEPAVLDERRDPATMVVDGLLGAAAGVPARLVNRLDAAFDELLANPHG
jgi:hypothetical protein